MDDKDGTLMENFNSKNITSKIYNEVILAENSHNLPENNLVSKLKFFKINVNKTEEK